MLGRSGVVKLAVISLSLIYGHVKVGVFFSVVFFLKQPCENFFQRVHNDGMENTRWKK